MSFLPHETCPVFAWMLTLSTCEATIRFTDIKQSSARSAVTPKINHSNLTFLTGLGRYSTSNDHLACVADVPFRAQERSVGGLGRQGEGTPTRSG